MGKFERSSKNLDPITTLLHILHIFGRVSSCLPATYRTMRGADGFMINSKASSTRLPASVWLDRSFIILRAASHNNENVQMLRDTSSKYIECQKYSTQKNTCK